MKEEGKGRASLRRHELSVVACDLRGFTALLEAAAPELVIELLRDYYVAVAEEVLRFGATIKEHAGDGVLVLVGASGPTADHASSALGMAVAIRAGTAQALARAHVAGAEVGLGIGVASGPITVGTIEAGSRLESIAVGSAVNLAARLCARAGAGQVLVGERTVELLGRDGSGTLEPVEYVRLKGFARAVRVFEARAT